MQIHFHVVYICLTSDIVKTTVVDAGPKGVVLVHKKETGPPQLPGSRGCISPWPLFQGGDLEKAAGG